jgi:hypothetical protein
MSERPNVGKIRVVRLSDARLISASAGRRQFFRNWKSEQAWFPVAERWRDRHI